jgi:hypothetical protein
MVMSGKSVFWMPTAWAAACGGSASAAIAARDPAADAPRKSRRDDLRFDMINSFDQGFSGKANDSTFAPDAMATYCLPSTV